MGVDDLSDLTPQERAEILRSRMAAVKGKHADTPTPQQDTQTPAFDPDLVPEVDPDDLKLPEPLQQLDDFVNTLDIVEAYRVLINKSEPEDRGQKEVQVSCPNPVHPDTNPSASLNREKNAWVCYGCGAKGDTMDLAAIHFGAAWPETYKTNGEFHGLKRQLGEKFGIHVHKSPMTGKEYLTRDEEPEIPEPESEEPQHLASVTQLPPPPDAPTEIELQLRDDDLIIDWEHLIPKDTFLYRWIQSLAIDAIPHEYHFWVGLTAIGLAAGHDIVLKDRKNVKGNLYVCIYGPTGIGKTQAIDPVEQLLREAAPYEGDYYDPPTGVKLLSSPASGEKFIDHFKYNMLDPVTNKPTGQHGNVVGLLNQGEFAELMKKASRMGSSLKEVMINMFDASVTKTISTSAVTSDEKLAVGPYCSIVTSTQPDAIRKFLQQADVESGTLNRFIFADGRARMDPPDLQEEEPDLTAAIDAYKDLMAWIFTNRGAELEIIGTTARPVWKDFFDANLKAWRAGQQSQESIFARIDLILKKVLLLFCINEKKLVPDADVMERVLSLYPYLRHTYARFSENLAASEAKQLENDIKAACVELEDKQGKAPSQRDIGRALKRYTAEDVKRQISVLVAMGELEEIPPETGKRGRPTERYRYIE